MAAPTWEQVLAAVEEDARRAARVVRTAADPWANGAEPAEWTLPAADLPPLSAMPPVPAHLRARVEALREQIRELQEELVHTLGERQPWQRAVPAPVPATTPRYVDRRA